MKPALLYITFLLALTFTHYATALRHSRHHNHHRMTQDGCLAPPEVQQAIEEALERSEVQQVIENVQEAAVEGAIEAITHQEVADEINKWATEEFDAAVAAIVVESAGEAQQGEGASGSQEEGFREKLNALEEVTGVSLEGLAEAVGEKADISPESAKEAIRLLVASAASVKEITEDAQSMTYEEMIENLASSIVQITEMAASQGLTFEDYFDNVNKLRAPISDENFQEKIEAVKAVTGLSVEDFVASIEKEANVPTEYARDIFELIIGTAESPEEIIENTKGQTPEEVVAAITGAAAQVNQVAETQDLSYGEAVEQVNQQGSGLEILDISEEDASEQVNDIVYGEPEEVDGCLTSRQVEEAVSEAIETSGVEELVEAVESAAVEKALEAVAETYVESG